MGTINVDKDGYVTLSDFSPYMDVSKVTYYLVKIKKNGTIKLKFYDKNKKLVKPYGTKGTNPYCTVHDCHSNYSVSKSSERQKAKKTIKNEQNEE